MTGPRHGQEGLRHARRESIFFRPVDGVWTTDEVRTNAAGRFAFARVVGGRYALRIEHANLCAAEIGDLRVDSDRPLDVPPIVLQPGAVVAGVVRAADGSPVEGFEVVVLGPAQRETAARRWTTVSGEGGKFQLPVRLPSGRYQIWAIAATKADNPLLQTVQIRDSTRPLSIAPGADKVQLDVTVPR